MAESIKYDFDEEQGFFCTPQGQEMYHTDVVEALNALLAVVRAIQEESQKEIPVVSLPKTMKALAALPEYLRGDVDE